MADTLSTRVALLSSRDLRAAIETAAANSKQVRAAIEVAVTNQLDEQQRRRALRRAAVTGELAPPLSVPTSGERTPLYSLLFADEVRASGRRSSNCALTRVWFVLCGAAGDQLPVTARQGRQRRSHQSILEAIFACCLR